MRELIKIDIDVNTVRIEIRENEEIIAVDSFPSKWAFKNNSINQLNELLSANSHPQLSDIEKSQLNTWINEV
jgi:hypothetical protein